MITAIVAWINVKYKFNYKDIFWGTVLIDVCSIIGVYHTIALFV